MLGVASDPENLAVIESFSTFLRALGHRLLPLAGARPLDRLERARPEVQELSMLLACLATPSPLEAQKIASFRSREQDPWATVGDPWQSKKNDVEATSPTTSCIQYVTVEKLVEKIIEKPSAQPKLSSEASTNTEDLVEVTGKVDVVVKNISVQCDPVPELKEAYIFDSEEKNGCTPEGPLQGSAGEMHIGEMREAGTQTLESPHFPTIQCEYIEMKEVLAKVNSDGNPLEIAVERCFSILGIKSSLRGADATIKNNKIEIVLHVTDSREVLGERGSMLKALSPMLAEAVGMNHEDLKIFITRV